MRGSEYISYANQLNRDKKNGTNVACIRVRDVQLRTTLIGLECCSIVLMRHARDGLGCTIIDRGAKNLKFCAAVCNDYQVLFTCKCFSIVRYFIRYQQKCIRNVVKYLF